MPRPEEKDHLISITFPLPAAGGKAVTLGPKALAEAHLAELRQALRQAVEKGKVRDPELTARGLSLRMKRNKEYVYKMLEGFTSLKVEEVCRLLALLAVPPQAFFFSCFPLGGELETRLRQSQAGDAPRLGGPDLGAHIRRPASGREVGVAGRAGRLLKAQIRRAGRSIRGLSAELGLGSPHVLGLALRGNTRLTFEHVFPVLAALGLSPARFFVELFGPEDRELPLPGLSWNRLLDEIEARDREMLRGFAAERQRRGLHPPVAPGE